MVRNHVALNSVCLRMFVCVFSQVKKNVNQDVETGNGVCVWHTKVTAAWALEKEPVLVLPASRKSKHSVARFPATGRSSLEVNAT